MSAPPANETTETTGPIRVLLVEDDPSVMASISRVLGVAGYTVTGETDVPDAQARLGSTTFDVVVTDFGLPSGTGLEILATAQERDRTLPVLIVSGSADLQKAHTAVGQGALRFLTKPVEPGRLLAAIEEACRTRAAVSAALGTANPRYSHRHHADLARMKASSSLDDALASMWLAFQPVVAVNDGRILGYEALLRSDHAELARPDVLLKVADDLARIWDVSRRVRAAAARQLAALPSTQILLVNVHARDLLDPDLFDADAPLSIAAERVILEITERASFTDIPDLAERLVALRRLRFRLALDDLGAGYGSLSALALVRPELVKLDMSLIRGIDADPVRREVVRSIGAMCKHLGTTWLCEGVETEAELRTVIECGTDLVQGYLLGRPARIPAVQIGPALGEILDGRPLEAR